MILGLGVFRVADPEPDTYFPIRGLGGGVLAQRNLCSWEVITNNQLPTQKNAFYNQTWIATDMSKCFNI